MDSHTYSVERLAIIETGRRSCQRRGRAQGERVAVGGRDHSSERGPALRRARHRSRRLKADPGGPGFTMIGLSSDVRVWLATGHTDMRKGFGSLALLVQETLKRNPHDGNLFVFRGRRGQLTTFRIQLDTSNYR